MSGAGKEVMTAAVRRLIVNADDFGQSFGINRGVFKAHEEGVVTSASLMVRWPAAEEAARYARARERLSLGLHFDLCEWVYRDGEWRPLYSVVAGEDDAAVAEELRRQLEIFRGLVGRDPTHLDSHQHVHRAGAARAHMTELAHQLSIPLRGADARVRYCGEFYGQTWDGRPRPEALCVDSLINILRRLPEGVTELGCHPGLDVELETMYRAEREEETSVLCDPRVRAAVEAEGIKLCSFRDVWPGEKSISA